MKDTLSLFQGKKKYQSKNTAGNYFADAYSQHEIGDGALKPIYVCEDEGDDQRIGENGRYRGKELIKGASSLLFPGSL